MCGFIHTLPTLWGWAFRRLRRLLRTNAYAAMHKMACFESAAIVSECEKMTLGGRTVCYWYTKYPPGSLSASTVGGRRVCSQLPSHSVCGHSTIVAWCVRVIQQSSSSSLQTTIVGPTKVAWCVPSFSIALWWIFGRTFQLDFSKKITYSKLLQCVSIVILGNVCEARNIISEAFMFYASAMEFGSENREWNHQKDGNKINASDKLYQMSGCFFR